MASTINSTSLYLYHFRTTIPYREKINHTPVLKPIWNSRNSPGTFHCTSVLFKQPRSTISHGQVDKSLVSCSDQSNAVEVLIQFIRILMFFGYCLHEALGLVLCETLWWWDIEIFHLQDVLKNDSGIDLNFKFLESTILMT